MQGNSGIIISIKVKILIVVSGRYPTPQASSKRLANYIKALEHEQTTVEVLTVFFTPNTSIQDLLFAHLVPFKAFRNVFKRAKHCSTVFIYGFGWFGKLMIIFASRLRGKMSSLEVNEMPYAIHGSRRDYILKYFEPFHKFCLTRIVYSQADGFIVISEALLQFIERYKKKKAIICKVPILVDFDYFQENVSKPECFVPYIIHSATLNDHKDGIIHVFKAFARLITDYRTDLHFYLTSQRALPDVRNQIDDIIAHYNLESRIHFLGDIEENTLLAFQAHCSFVVVNKIECEQNRYNFATKIGEYLALGKPVITTRIGEVSNYLKHNISCLFVEPNNDEEIAGSILRIMNDHHLSEKIGQAGKMIAQSEFDIYAKSEKIITFFKELIKN